MTEPNFNQKQQLSIDLIKQFISKDVPEKIFYLFGYAGTGKTFLISYVVKKLLKDYQVSHIYVCAPTHKALNVLESYFKSTFQSKEQSDPILNKSISFMTIHRLLEFKPIISAENGARNFKSVKDSKFLKQIVDRLVIIDECSMISTSMIAELNKYTDIYPIKIIYLGDQAQLPPVGEPESPIFSSVPSKYQYQYQITLDEIMRTNAISIKKVATIIRKSPFADPIVKSKDSPNVFGKHLLAVYTDKKDNAPIKTFRMYHKKSNPLDATWFKTFITNLNKGHIPIILTWRNATSDYYNLLVREYVHGKTELNNYEIGDYIMFNDFYSVPDDPSKLSNFYTSDMAKILEITTETRNLIDWDTYKIPSTTLIDKKYNLLINKLTKLMTEVEFNVDIFTVKRIYSYINANDSMDLQNILTINRSELNRYRSLLEMVREHIEYFYKQFKSEKHMAKLWDVYYKKLINPYAELSFGYSITTHKAQGSTFDMVMVDVEDIMENPDLNEVQKALYTASTRASNELGFLIK